MNSGESNQVSQTPFDKLRRAGSILRLVAIAVVLAATSALFMYAVGWLTPRTLSPASMINTFEQVNGSHPGFRRNHANGVCLTAYFISTCHAHTPPITASLLIS